MMARFNYFSILENLDNFRRRVSGDDDAATVSRATTAQLVNTLYINLFLFTVLMSLFELLRRNKSIYMNRRVKRFIETKRVPEVPSNFPLAWIWKIMLVSLFAF